MYFFLYIYLPLQNPSQIHPLFIPTQFYVLFCIFSSSHQVQFVPPYTAGGVVFSSRVVDLLGSTCLNQGAPPLTVTISCQ